MNYYRKEIRVWLFHFSFEFIPEERKWKKYFIQLLNGKESYNVILGHCIISGHQWLRLREVCRENKISSSYSMYGMDVWSFFLLLWNIINSKWIIALSSDRNNTIRNNTKILIAFFVIIDLQHIRYWIK